MKSVVEVIENHFDRWRGNGAGVVDLQFLARTNLRKWQRVSTPRRPLRIRRSGFDYAFCLMMTRLH